MENAGRYFFYPAKTCPILILGCSCQNGAHTMFVAGEGGQKKCLWCVPNCNAILFAASSSVMLPHDVPPNGTLKEEEDCFHLISIREGSGIT